MKSSSISIMMAAVIFAAAFAGLAIITDEADAAETQDTYKVTYVYGDNVKIETSGADLKLKAFDTVFPGVDAPKGYMFDKWKIGSTQYAEEGTALITGDVTVEPVFKADRAIVQLTYVTVDGKTITVECMGDGTVTLVEGEMSEDKEITRAYSVSDGDLKKFAEAIGAKVVEKSSTGSVGITITGFKLDGYEFKGFVKATATDGDPSDDLSKLTANATYVVKQSGSENSYTYTAELKRADVAEYIAVFEPIYNVAFYIDGTNILSITSDKIVLNGDGRTIPIAPVRENYIFLGWYDILGEKIVGYSVDKNEYTLAKGFEFTEDTALFAKFVPLTFTVTFVYGEDQKVFITETVKYGEKAIEPNGLPAGYKGWDFDFSEAIVEDTVIEAIVADPVTIYNVTFEIEGKTPVTQKSDSLVVPDTSIDGKVFKGWVVKGQTQYVDPAKYDITQDVTFVAIYDKAPAPAGPGFFQTSFGQCTIVLLIVVILVFAYAVHTNMFGLKDTLASFKLQRVRKE